VELDVLAGADVLDLALADGQLGAGELDLGKDGLSAGRGAVRPDQAERPPFLEHAQRQAIAPGRRLGRDGHAKLIANLLAGGPHPARIHAISRLGVTNRPLEAPVVDQTGADEVAARSLA